MADDTVLHIGFDDTDSPSGMCTTFLAYKMAGMLRRDGAEFLDFPRLVRLNPNIPWKTRGNGAVSLRVRTGSPERVKRRARELVSRYSDVRNGANPGLVFLEGDGVPPALSEFARLALWQLVRRGGARELAARNGLEVWCHGNGQGLVGAIGAIGYQFDDSTLELLSYRRRSRFGSRRSISAQSVRQMQERTAPRTFNSYDARKGRILISPRGPDPVFYGIRGEDVRTLLGAARMIKSDEEPDGFMIFRSNQGTGDHLRNSLDPADMRPYSSGSMRGTVSVAPETGRGGPVFFGISSGRDTVMCAAYTPTGLGRVASGLVCGDRVAVGGGVRRASAGRPRILNLEFVRITRLEKREIHANPGCPDCGKSMKSKGRGQGFQCARCGRRSDARVLRAVPRDVSVGLHLPDVSAHRHLSRPYQRLGTKGSAEFRPCRWFHENR